VHRVQEQEERHIHTPHIAFWLRRDAALVSRQAQAYDEVNSDAAGAQGMGLCCAAVIRQRLQLQIRKIHHWTTTAGMRTQVGKIA
jgi:hypothetical protein